MQVFAQKSTLMISKKQTWSTKNDRVLEKWWKMQYRLCIMPFLEVTILFNQHLHYRGEYGGKTLDGHSKLIYSVLKHLKLQNYWHIFDRPVSSMHCKYAEYACKLQTSLSMNNKHCHDMQKNTTSYCYFQKNKMQNAQYLPKNMLMTSKKNMINKHDRILEKMQHRLCVMPFLEATILLNQHFIVGGNTVGQSPTGILTLFI